MISNDNSYIAVNDFSLIPFIPYKIVEALLLSTSREAENFFKCLKYSESDCLEKSDLTLEEKRKMLWSPNQNDWTQEQNFNIFLKPLIGNSLDDSEQQTQMRVYEYNIIPTTNKTAVISYAFDFITEEKTSLIFYEGIIVERTSFMESCILNIFNGRDLSIGINYFQFSRDFNRYSGSTLNISNSKSFYGRTLIMGLLYSDPGSGGSCG